MSEFFFMEASWGEALSEEFHKPYMKNLQLFLSTEVDKGVTIYPPKERIFHAFCITPFDKIKVVIMGQDPYHNPGQAEGLSFSVSKEVKIPPSLQNIYKELQEDMGIFPPKHGSLVSWATQGVLLLNATLTVRKNEPRSHYGKGWEEFTDAVIRLLVSKKDPIVFILWGKSAQEKCRHVMQSKSSHLLLESPHPSPYSAQGFFGCKHFSKANKFLQTVGKKTIDWNIPD